MATPNRTAESFARQPEILADSLSGPRDWPEWTDDDCWELGPDSSGSDIAPASRFVDPWSLDWAAGYDATLRGEPVDPGCTPGQAAGYLAGLRALGRGASRMPPAIDFPALLDQAEREGWNGDELRVPPGLTQGQAEEYVVTWADGRRQRAQDEVDMTAEMAAW